MFHLNRKIQLHSKLTEFRKNFNCNLACFIILMALLAYIYIWRLLQTSQLIAEVEVSNLSFTVTPFVFFINVSVVNYREDCSVGTTCLCASAPEGGRWKSETLEGAEVLEACYWRVAEVWCASNPNWPGILHMTYNVIVVLSVIYQAR